MKLSSTDTLNSSVAVTLTQITRLRVKWRSGQKAQFTCQTVLKFQSRISRNAFQIDGRYVFSVRLAKNKVTPVHRTQAFFCTVWFLDGWPIGKNNLRLRCTPSRVRLAYRSSIAPLSSTGTVLCFVSCGLNQTRGFSPGTPPWLSSVIKIEPCRDGNLLIGGILWRFL